MMSFLQSIPVGARYMLMSALGFALMGVFVKLASLSHIPILEIVAARSFVSLIISYIDIKRKNIPLFGQRKGLLTARGLVGAFALVCVYYALVNIPLAEASVLQYLHPMFTAVLAIIFLRERLQWPTLVCIGLSFIGLIAIVRPAFLFSTMAHNLEVWAIVAALMGAFGSAVAYVLVRKLNQTEDSSVIIFYFPLVALPLSLLLLGDNFVMPDGWSWLVLFMVGITTQVGQVGLTKAMQTETAAKATSFSYLQVLFAIVFGVLFFDEIPTLWTLIGATMILLGAFINVMPRRSAVN